MTDTASTHVRPELIRWRTGDVELSYTDSGGDGDVMLLLHGGGLADWFTPLAADPALHGNRVIRLVRAGYTDAPVPDGLTVSDHSEHAAALLRHLGVAPAHVVAHSSGCTVALQLAMTHPDLVRTLSLCEPPLVAALADPVDHELLRAQFGPAIGAAIAAVSRGDLPAAFDTFMTLVCGADHRAVMTATLGADVVEDAVNRCRYLFTQESPAINAWTFDPATLAHPHPPVLLIQGGASHPTVHRLIARLAGLIPNATIATIPDANHLLPLTKPTELGRIIDDFCRSSTTR
ncbi:alpha/beta hydrolase [Dactylosporangium sp. NPDC050588]|uniref:alpha/beta fold hydrolase n=1 Tax=Dactylosporangium sp. NPDC050588 TaxID=3157211 RepID=UPI0033D6015A